MISTLIICAQQCHPSVLPSSCAHQCRPGVSAAYQCPSLLDSSAASSVPPYQCPPVPPHQCSLLVPIGAAYPFHLISAHQWRLSVPISAASSMHISEGEKLPVCKIL
ncbi:unnamed protein product [Staurois parvus]|uniref:Uncharacterized protein n=1 Tax=Staurois parvus TaxID=386267 RepID=A0ABN9CHL8_9NEOB|nr:unnamed protein product [Staurois parvus]